MVKNARYARQRNGRTRAGSTARVDRLRSELGGISRKLHTIIPHISFSEGFAPKSVIEEIDELIELGMLHLAEQKISKLRNRFAAELIHFFKISIETAPIARRDRGRVIEIYDKARRLGPGNRQFNTCVAAGDAYALAITQPLTRRRRAV